MKILGIETSCDETAASVVEDGAKVLSNKIASQIEIHARYGGVVPEVASRQHMLAIIPVIEQAMAEAKTGWADIDAIAVTKGPGAGRLTPGGSEYGQSNRPRAPAAFDWGQSSGRPHLCQLADGR